MIPTGLVSMRSNTLGVKSFCAGLVISCVHYGFQCAVLRHIVALKHPLWIIQGSGELSLMWHSSQDTFFIMNIGNLVSILIMIYWLLHWPCNQCPLISSRHYCNKIIWSKSLIYLLLSNILGSNLLLVSSTILFLFTVWCFL